MLFVCLLFYRCKYRFIWWFEVFAAVGAIKSLFYSQMRLNRISGGQTEGVSGCERLGMQSHRLKNCKRNGKKRRGEQ